MIDFKELTIKRLQNARDEYVEIREEISALRANRQKMSKRIALLRKLLALDEDGNEKPSVFGQDA